MSSQLGVNQHRDDLAGHELPPAGMTRIPSGTFRMGSDVDYPEEGMAKCPIIVPLRSKRFDAAGRVTVMFTSRVFHRCSGIPRPEPDTFPRDLRSRRDRGMSGRVGPHEDHPAEMFRPYATKIR